MDLLQTFFCSASAVSDFEQEFFAAHGAHEAHREASVTVDDALFDLSENLSCSRFGALVYGNLVLAHISRAAIHLDHSNDRARSVGHFHFRHPARTGYAERSQGKWSLGLVLSTWSGNDFGFVCSSTGHADFLAQIVFFFLNANFLFTTSVDVVFIWLSSKSARRAADELPVCLFLNDLNDFSHYNLNRLYEIKLLKNPIYS